MKPSAQLSILKSARTDTVQTRKVAILADDGCDDGDLNALLRGLSAAGAQAKVVAPRLGYIISSEGNDIKVHSSLLTTSSVLFDAVFVPGGEKSSAALMRDPAAAEFVAEAYKHAKAIGASGSGVRLLRAARILEDKDAASDDPLLVVEQGPAENVVAAFIDAMAQHRNWEREKMLRPDLNNPKDGTQK